MIEETAVDGTKAKVVNLTRDFDPTTREKAELIEVVFEDEQRVSHRDGRQDEPR